MPRTIVKGSKLELIKSRHFGLMRSAFRIHGGINSNRIRNGPPGRSGMSNDELFQRLVAAGLVNLAEPIKKEEPEKEKPEILPVSFTDEKSLKVKQPALISSLHIGMQCSSCGLRFATSEQTSRYRRHLDWHFQKNRKEKESIKKGRSSRAFFYDISDWTQSEEMEELEDRGKPNIFLNL